MKKILCILIGLSLGFIARTEVYGTQVQSVETDSSVNFIGVYEPIGTPDPPPEIGTKPPINEAQPPRGSLPKTNMTVSHWMVGLGIGMIFFILLIVTRRKKQKKEGMSI